MVIYASFSVAVVDCVSRGLGWVVVVEDTGCAAATTCGRAAGDSDFFLSRRHFDFVPNCH